MKVIRCGMCLQRMDYELEDNTGWRYYVCRTCGNTLSEHRNATAQHVAQLTRERREKEQRLCLSQVVSVEPQP
jgi:hypothetical protein